MVPADGVGRQCVRRQRFVRQRKLRGCWYELIEDLVGYHRLMRQLKLTRAATRVQRFVRRRALRSRWYSMIEDVLGYNSLMRQLKQGRAAKRIQAHARRRVAFVKVAKLYADHHELKLAARRS